MPKKTLSKSHLEFPDQITKITNLIVSFCYPIYLFELLKCIHMLKYLNIKHIEIKDIYDKSQFFNLQ